MLFQQNEKKQYILPADTPNSTKIHECAFRKNMKHLSIRNSEHSGSAPSKGSCAFKLRHYTALRRHARQGGRCGGIRVFLARQSDAFSSCCGEYRSAPADSRTVVPIKAENSVHTPLPTAKIVQKLYVFVQLLMKYVGIKIKNSCLHKPSLAFLLHIHIERGRIFELISI